LSHGAKVLKSSLLKIDRIGFKFYIKDF